MDKRFTLIPVKKETRDQLRQMCSDEGISYDYLLRQMIKKYQGD